MATKKGRRQRNKFIEASGAAIQVGMKQAKVLEGIVNAPRELEFAFGVLVAEGLLHMAEETTSPWNGNKSHRTEFAKDLVPTLDGGAFLGEGDFTQNVGKALETMWWQGQGHGSCVNNPSQDHFTSGPGGITL